MLCGEIFVMREFNALRAYPPRYVGPHIRTIKNRDCGFVS